VRVVSLLPSATEICFALGVEPVGVSHECDHPEAATDLPPVNELRIDDSGASADINQAVADADAGEGVYAIDRERLAALDPDLVLTQGVCDVCAVDRVLVREAIEDLALDAEVLTVDVHSMADLYRSIERIGTACSRAERADRLVEELRGRVAAVDQRTSQTDRPRVAVLDWLDPVMVAGHWVPELVETAGGQYDMEAAGAHSRPREWTEVREYDPEVLIVSPCGFELPQIRENLSDLRTRPGWKKVTAVETGRVALVDGHHYVNRAGPRLVETLEYIAAIIAPDRVERPPPEAVQRLDTVSV